MPVLDNDEDIKKVLKESKTVAVVGISPKPEKPAYFVSEVVKRYGFKMYFINPVYAGQEILGEKVLSSFEDIPEDIDIVDVFRNPSAVPDIAKEAKKKGFKTFWLQPGTVNEDVVKQLSQEGYNVVVDRCMKVECMRLLEGKDD
jgi:predicted CoA-binding protein